MSDWRPMADNPFPWKHRDVILAVFDQEKPEEVEILRAVCAEHGAYFIKDAGCISVNERGLIPFAWRPDDFPARDDEKFPPMWTDYLTEAAE